MSLRLAITALAFCLLSVGPVPAQSPKGHLAGMQHGKTPKGNSILVVLRGERHKRATSEHDAPNVFFLLDENAVFGCGHAAMLVGDERGWDYFSFGPHSQNQVVENNLVHRHFDSLAAACASEELRRYTKHMYWSTTDESAGAAVRQRVLQMWDKSSYDLLQRNCFTMVGDAIQAGCFNIDITSSVPVVAFKANEENANGHGAWPVIQP